MCASLLVNEVKLMLFTRAAVTARLGTRGSGGLHLTARQAPSATSWSCEMCVSQGQPPSSPSAEHAQVGALAGSVGGSVNPPGAATDFKVTRYRAESC